MSYHSPFAEKETEVKQVAWFDQGHTAIKLQSIAFNLYRIWPAITEQIYQHEDYFTEVKSFA